MFAGFCIEQHLCCIERQQRCCSAIFVGIKLVLAAGLLSVFQKKASSFGSWKVMSSPLVTSRFLRLCDPRWKGFGGFAYPFGVKRRIYMYVFIKKNIHILKYFLVYVHDFLYIFFSNVFSKFFHRNLSTLHAHVFGENGNSFRILILSTQLFVREVEQFNFLSKQGLSEL